MALEKKGSTVYANITDLPLISDLRNGDTFIVQTANGTRRFDYKSLLIPLSKTTFQETFNEMSQLYSTTNITLNKVGDSPITVSGLSADNANLCDAVNQLNVNVNAITMEQIPLGTIVSKFDVPPSSGDGEKQGYLPMNGQVVSKTIYNKLYNYLISLNLIESSVTENFTMPKATAKSIEIEGKDPQLAYYYIKY